MRKLLLLLIITLASLNVTAQTTHAAYCEVVLYNVGFFKKKLTAVVDAGTEKRGYIMNKDGSIKIFKSHVDMLNYFGKFGWTVTQNYFISEFWYKKRVLHLLLTKQVACDEDAFAGLNIKNPSDEKSKDDVYSML